MKKFWLTMCACAALTLPLRAQQPQVMPPASSIVPVSQGATVITLTYPGPRGQTLQSHFNLIIPPFPIALIQPINALNPPRWSDSAVTNGPFCMFAWATDIVGRTLTGRPVGWTTNDSGIARAVRSPTCPDTTIDPAKMQSFPTPLPQAANTVTPPPDTPIVKRED